MITTYNNPMSYLDYFKSFLYSNCNKYVCKTIKNDNNFIIVFTDGTNLILSYNLDIAKIEYVLRCLTYLIDFKYDEHDIYCYINGNILYWANTSNILVNNNSMINIINDKYLHF